MRILSLFLFIAIFIVTFSLAAHEKVLELLKDRLTTIEDQTKLLRTTANERQLRMDLFRLCNETLRLARHDVHESVFNGRDSLDYANLLRRAGKSFVAAGSEIEGLNLLREALEVTKRLAFDKLTLSEKEALTRTGHEINDEEIARALFDLGVAQDRVGRYEEGYQHLVGALSMRRKLFGHFPKHKEGNRQIAQSLVALGDVANKKGHYDIGNNLLHEAVDIFHDINDKQDALETADALVLLGTGHVNSENGFAGSKHFSRALEIYSRLNEKHMDGDDFDETHLENVAEAHAGLAGALAATGDRPGMSKHLAEAVRLRKQKKVLDLKFADFVIYVARTLSTSPDKYDLELSKKFVNMAKKVYEDLNHPLPPDEIDPDFAQDDDF